MHADQIEKGKLLFQTKACFTCHQIDMKFPAPQAWP
ncbi:MAG: c-type cytochrome [Opitutae bacterium]|nr:c-type cytochrome [Opitutae bacterium]